MTTPTIQTPPLQQPARKHPAARFGLAGLLLVLSIVGYVDAQKYGLIPAAPKVAVSASCLPDGRAVLDVEVSHMPGRVATVDAYTAADGGVTWNGGEDVHLDRRAGLYEGVGVPEGVVAVEVTPERQGTLPAQRVDVPTCGRGVR